MVIFIILYTMNEFASAYLLKYSEGSSCRKVVRDCCDHPLDVTVYMGGRPVNFKLGVLCESNLIYAELASDGCRSFGNLCGKYPLKINGIDYDFRNYTDAQLLEKWCQIIDDFNNPECLLNESDDFIV